MKESCFVKISNTFVLITWTFYLLLVQRNHFPRIATEFAGPSAKWKSRTPYSTVIKNFNSRESNQACMGPWEYWAPCSAQVARPGSQLRSFSPIVLKRNKEQRTIPLLPLLILSPPPPQSHKKEEEKKSKGEQRRNTEENKYEQSKYQKQPF